MVAVYLHNNKDVTKPIYVGVFDDIFAAEVYVEMKMGYYKTYKQSVKHDGDLSTYTVTPDGNKLWNTDTVHIRQIDPEQYLNKEIKVGRFKTANEAYKEYVRKQRFSLIDAEVYGNSGDGLVVIDYILLACLAFGPFCYSCVTGKSYLCFFSPLIFLSIWCLTEYLSYLCGTRWPFTISRPTLISYFVGEHYRKKAIKDKKESNNRMPLRLDPANEVSVKYAATAFKEYIKNRIEETDLEFSSAIISTDIKMARMKAIMDKHRLDPNSFMYTESKSVYEVLQDQRGKIVQARSNNENLRVEVLNKLETIYTEINERLEINEIKVCYGLIEKNNKLLAKAESYVEDMEALVNSTNNTLKSSLEIPALSPSLDFALSAKG